MDNALSGHKTILLFGGSFDPPHKAHVLLPQQVAQAIGADLIVYIPAGRAPHKLDREQTDPHHRLAMLQLALGETDASVPTTILTDEIDRGTDRPSYTVDTLEALHSRMDPGARLRLLIGADQLRIFDTWRSPQRIIELAEPVVMVRPPDTRESLLGSLSQTQREEWSDRLVEVDAIDLSSTQLRRRVADHQSLQGDVAACVASYIAEHRLYEH